MAGQHWIVALCLLCSVRSRLLLLCLFSCCLLVQLSGFFSYLLTVHGAIHIVSILFPHAFFRRTGITLVRVNQLLDASVCTGFSVFVVRHLGVRPAPAFSVELKSKDLVAFLTGDFCTATSKAVERYFRANSKDDAIITWVLSATCLFAGLLPVCLCFYLVGWLVDWLGICLFICQSNWLFIRLFGCLAVYLPFSLSLFLSLSLSPSLSSSLPIINPLSYYSTLSSSS